MSTPGNTRPADGTPADTAPAKPAAPGPTVAKSDGKAPATKTENTEPTPAEKRPADGTPADTAPAKPAAPGPTAAKSDGDASAGANKNNKPKAAAKRPADAPADTTRLAKRWQPKKGELKVFHNNSNKNEPPQTVPIDRGRPLEQLQRMVGMPKGEKGFITHLTCTDGRFRVVVNEEARTPELIAAGCRPNEAAVKQLGRLLGGRPPWGNVVVGLTADDK